MRFRSSAIETGGDSNPALHGAIVLGTDVNGISVIRSLGRLGVACAAIFPAQTGDHAYHSKYLDVVYRVAQNADDGELLIALSRVAGMLDGSRPVLIPKSDRYSQFVCTNQTLLSENYMLNCADISIYDMFLDKRNTSSNLQDKLRIDSAEYLD